MQKKELTADECVEVFRRAWIYPDSEEARELLTRWMTDQIDGSIWNVIYSGNSPQKNVSPPSIGPPSTKS
jgi:hypothetical protein